MEKKTNTITNTEAEIISKQITEMYLTGVVTFKEAALKTAKYLKEFKNEVSN